MFLASSCSYLCAVYWSQVLSREWRFSWSSITTSEWSTILLSTKVRLILETWRYMYVTIYYISTRNIFIFTHYTGIILCMCPANERWRYIVTSSLIGWVYVQNDPWQYKHIHSAYLGHFNDELTHCPQGAVALILKCVIFKCIVVIPFTSISSLIDFRGTAQDSTDDKSTLVKVMAWCHQATSYYPWIIL